MTFAQLIKNVFKSHGAKLADFRKLSDEFDALESNLRASQGEKIRLQEVCGLARAKMLATFAPDDVLAFSNSATAFDDYEASLNFAQTHYVESLENMKQSTRTRDVCQSALDGAAGLIRAKIGELSARDAAHWAEQGLDAAVCEKSTPVKNLEGTLASIESARAMVKREDNGFWPVCRDLLESFAPDK